MSILNRLVPHRHLDDAVLAEIWTAAALREAQGRPEPNRATVGSSETASEVHLTDCAVCRARYADFCEWLETVRIESIEEADAAFPAERLAAQQAHILRRLEASERPARVIAFPKFAQPLSSRSSLASRWITVAAAAGLLIGVALGQWLDLTHRFEPRPQRTADTAVAVAPAQPKQADMVIQTTSAISDDALLQELDASLAMHPSVAPLRALDTITPRSRDFVDQSR